MRVLITGSRHWRDKAAIHRALAPLPKPHSAVIVVHGGAQGADTLAGMVAAELGMQVETHPADWSKHGRKAGPIRNQAMVTLGADICFAFPLEASVGTHDCIRRAKVAGIETIVWPATRLQRRLSDA